MNSKTMRSLVRELVETSRELAWDGQVLYKHPSPDGQGRMNYQWRPVGVQEIENLFRKYTQQVEFRDFYQATHRIGCDLVKEGYLEFEPNRIINNSSGKRYKGKLHESGKIELDAPGHRIIAEGLVFTKKALDIPSEARFWLVRIGKLLTILAAIVVAANQFIDLLTRLMLFSNSGGN